MNRRELLKAMLLAPVVGIWKQSLVPAIDMGITKDIAARCIVSKQTGPYEWSVVVTHA